MKSEREIAEMQHKLIGRIKAADQRICEDRSGPHYCDRQLGHAGAHGNSYTNWTNATPTAEAAQEPNVTPTGARGAPSNGVVRQAGETVITAAEAAQAEQYFRDAPSPPDAPPRAEAAESGAREMTREALVATIAVWAGSDSGKAAIAEALRLAGVACDELTASRRVDYRMMDIPIGVSAPASDGERRCETTKNPCGTDTWAKGHLCKCSQCQAWLGEELDRRYYAIEARDREIARLTDAHISIRHLNGTLIAKLDEAEAKLDAAMRVIAELVECKRLHDLIEGGPRMIGAYPDLGEYNILKTEYARRKPLAWEAARALKES